MAVRPVLPYGHPLLKSVSNPIPEFTDHSKKLLENLFRDMQDTVAAADGRGLSAVQIGAQYRVIYIAKPIAHEPLFMVNPVMVGHSDLFQHYVEGCMSCPGIDLDIQRYASVRIAARKANGDDLTVDASGLLAQAIQHELNHLNGRSPIDCAKPAKRRFLTEKMRQFGGRKGMLLDYGSQEAKGA